MMVDISELLELRDESSSPRDFKKSQETKQSTLRNGTKEEYLFSTKRGTREVDVPTTSYELIGEDDRLRTWLACLRFG